MEKNVLAKINDIEITKQQMVNVIRSLPQQQAMEVSSEQGRKRLLEELIAGEMFYLDAVENGLDKDEEFIKGLEEAKHGLLQRFAVQKILQGIKVTEDEMKQYYEANKSQFVNPEEVTARHILVNEEEDCNKIKKEIEDGLDFNEAAKKYSTCPSKAQGGNLGSFSRGKMVPEFEKTAFELEIGKISEPVKTQFGYHLIVVDSKKESKEKSYEESAEQIRQKLINEKQFTVYNENINRLKSKYNVEINEEELK